MLSNAIPRFRPTYRADEIGLVIDLAKRGESLGFVGIAGVGKSNLVRFLYNIQEHVPQVGQGIERLHFPVVDANQWQGTPDSLWKMMVNALNQVTQNLPPPPEDSKVIPFSDNERAFKTLQEQLRWICHNQQHQVMFVLDDFDKVLEAGPLDMLERLYGLRSDDNKGLLSYLVFTKQLPHILGQDHPLEDHSKFYDLFKQDIYALEPYFKEDAMRMLKHLNELADSPLVESDLEQIYQMTGGQAVLLKTVFNIWVKEGASGLKNKYFADKPDVQNECRRILKYLHPHEREVVRQLAQGQSLSNENQAVVDFLMRRGLIVQLDPITWFSPLVAQFLSTYNE